MIGVYKQCPDRRLCGSEVCCSEIGCQLGERKYLKHSHSEIGVGGPSMAGQVTTDHGGMYT